MQKINEYLDSRLFVHFLYGLLLGSFVFAAHPITIALLVLAIIANKLAQKLRESQGKNV